MSSVAERFMSLFAGHSGAHGTHGEPYQEPGKLKWEIKKTARTIREPVTLELWEKHLKGEVPLGVITIRDDNTCSWGSIDVDKYDEDFSTLIKKIDKAKIPLVPCRSKSGGLHLFLFMEHPQPAGAVQTLLRDIAGSLGLSGSEIFPKQTHVLTERGDLGSWMVMPYFGQTYGDRLKEQVGVKGTGASMTATEFLRLAESHRLDEPTFVALSTKRGKARREEGDFADGPPCLQNLAKEGFPEGGRNNALFHLGIYYKKKTTQWKEQLEEANRVYMKPPLNSDEVQAAIKSLDKKEYEYTCKIEPMCSHCDSLLCRTRKFGVGDGVTNYPVITEISKLDSRPPTWFVDVQGIETRLALTSEQLHMPNLFARACMDEGNKFFPPMKPTLWAGIVGPAMENCTIIEVPPEASVQGQLLEHLGEYIENLRADTKEQILIGRPWEDEETQRYYFRMRDFAKYLKREDMRDENSKQIRERRIMQFIKDIGGGSHQFMLKKSFTRVVFVPSSAVERFTGTVEPSPIPGSRI